MRVLHVYKDAWPPIAGGVERHIDLLRTADPEVRGDLLACAGSPRGRISAREGGTDLLAGELGRIWSVPIAPSFVPRLAHAARRADVIHVHSPNPLGEAAALLGNGKTPLVVSVHADVVRQALALLPYARVLRRLLDRAGAILTGSHGFAASSPLLARHRDRVQVIPYGVDLERFDRARVPACARPCATVSARR
jgi:glycosyltransferase involved in cell wall biosynthesis